MELSEANITDFIFATPMSGVDPTVESVEEGIRNAEKLLATDVMAADRGVASTATYAGAAPLSAGRRRQILRDLAQERAGVRGYESQREKRLTTAATPPSRPTEHREPSVTLSPPPEQRQSSRPAQQGWASQSTVRASQSNVHSQASEMVHSAISNALSTTHAAGASSAVARRPGSARRSQKYQDPVARDQLIEQLLAERKQKQAKLRQSSASSHTAPPARSSAVHTPAKAAVVQHSHTHTHSYRSGAAGATDAFLSPATSPTRQAWAVAARSAPRPTPSSGLSRPGDSRLRSSGLGQVEQQQEGDVGAQEWDRDSLDGDVEVPAETSDAPFRRDEDAGGEEEGEDGADDHRGGGRGGSNTSRASSTHSHARSRSDRRSRDRDSGEAGAGDRSSTSRSKAKQKRKAREAARSRLFKRKSVDALKKRRESEEMKECTFKPKINKFRSTKTSMSREERLRRLAESNNDKYQNRQKLKAKLEAERSKECTFAPKINPQSRNYVKSRVRGENVAERLHREADHRAKQRAQARRESERQEVENFPFRPVINPDTHAILDLTDYKPIHERVGDLQRAKNDNLLRLRLARHNQNPDLTFRPKISEESEKLAHQRAAEVGVAGVGVTERLAREAELREKEKQRRARAWERKIAADNRFQPTISENSARIVAANPTYRKDFVTRQQVLQRRQEANMQQVAERVYSETNECTFRPSIGNATEVLVGTASARIEEDEQARVHRLAYQDAQRKAAKQERARDKFYSQFTYKPTLNKKSKVIGQSSTVEQMAADEARKASRAALARKYEEQESKECTFVPKTTKAPRHVVEFRRDEGGGAARFNLDIKKHPEQVVEKMNRYAKERARKIAKTKRQLEYQALQDCTFAPATNKARGAESSRPVVVRGLGRHLELKEMAKRLEEEQQQREKEAFEVKGAVTAGVPTVPRPFKLHTETHSAARARKLQLDAEAQQRQLCTFQPKTMESSKRELIQRLLREEEELAASSRAVATSSARMDAMQRQPPQQRGRRR